MIIIDNLQCKGPSAPGDSVSVATISLSVNKPYYILLCPNSNLKMIPGYGLRNHHLFHLHTGSILHDRYLFFLKITMVH